MELDFGLVLKLIGSSISIFVVSYFIAKMHHVGKFLLLACLAGVMYEYYQRFDEIYYLVWLGFYGIILLASIGENSLITTAKRYTSNETPLLKKIILQDRLFTAFGFVIMLACLLHIEFYPIVDSYFAYGLPIAIFMTSGLIADFTKLDKLHKSIDTQIANLEDSVLYFSLYALYNTCEVEDKGIKRTFVDEIINAKKDNGEIVEVTLLGTPCYFNPNVLDKLIILLEEFIQENPKIADKKAHKEIAKNLNLDPAEIVGDLVLLCQNVGKYCFKDTYHYIHNSNLDQFQFCSCCNGAQDRNEENDTQGEWFCSSVCEDIEKACIEISDTINPKVLENESPKEYYRRRAAIDRSNIFATTFSTLGVSETWAKNYQALSNANTGHGNAAEIMNHENDVWAGKNAIHKGPDNVSNGADRIVDGVEIQDKYCATAKDSVDSCFKTNNGAPCDYRYINKDGKPMVVEVPKDQYEACVKRMEQKIQEGKVPGISDPAEAKNIIKKGSVTLQEAKNYCKFCTKESLAYDARNGSITALSAFSVSFVINASVCYYRERDVKKALQESFVIGIATGGKAFAVYMLGAQAQRIPAIKSFLDAAIEIGFKEGSSVAKALAGAAGKQGGKGVAVNSAANNALKGTVVTAAATMAVTSSIEIVQMMRGQISGMQCVKNIAVNAGGIAGGAAGAIAGAAALSFIPGVGTLVGGFAGGMIGGMGGGAAVKKLMDVFVEDDVAKKQRIFFEQMIALSVMFKLSQKEAQILKNRIDRLIQGNKDFFGKQFNTKYMLPFANGVLKPIVVEIVSNRPKLPPQAFEKNIVAGAIAQELESA